MIINGRYYNTEPVDVLESTRPWADFHLADGTRLRVHVIVDSVVRLIDEYDSRGNPVYYVHARTVSATHAPDHLIQSPRSVSPDTVAEENQ